MTILVFCYSLLPTSQKENFPIEIQVTERRVKERAGDEGRCSNTLCSSAGLGFSSGIPGHRVPTLASEGTDYMNMVCRHTQAEHPYAQFHFNKEKEYEGKKGREEGRTDVCCPQCGSYGALTSFQHIER